MSAFEVIYHDQWLIVLDKPTGLLAVPGRGPEKQDCLSARVQHAWSDALVVHRLDRDTSGVLVMARGLDMQRDLSRQFETRKVDKTYLAIVEGQPAEEQGKIDLPLRKDFEYPPRHCVDLEQGRPALTRWQVLDRQHDRTRLRLEPITGRSHQLRVHLAALGHPILGDPLYASPAALAMAERLLLHALSLTLMHPATGERMTWTAACPF